MTACGEVACNLGNVAVRVLQVFDRVPHRDDIRPFGGRKRQVVANRRAHIHGICRVRHGIVRDINAFGRGNVIAHDVQEESVRAPDFQQVFLTKIRDDPDKRFSALSEINLQALALFDVIQVFLAMKVFASVKSRELRVGQLDVGARKSAIAASDQAAPMAPKIRSQAH